VERSGASRLLRSGLGWVVWVPGVVSVGGISRSTHSLTHARVRAQTAADQDQPVLVVGLLDGQLRFFSSGGTQKFKDRQVGGDPLTMDLMHGEYLLVAGTDK